MQRHHAWYNGQRSRPERGAAEHLSSICSRSPPVCNAVTENAHAELRLSICIKVCPVILLLIQTMGAGVGWGVGCRPLRGRLGLFILIYSGIAAASRRGCPASGGPRHANHHVPNARGGVCAPLSPYLLSTQTSPSRLRAAAALMG